MAGENDQTDEIFGGTEDDDISATLRANLEEQRKDGDDKDDQEEGGFEQPLKEDDIEKRDTVEEEEGVKRIEKSRDAKIGAGKDDKPQKDGEAPDAKKAETKDKDAAPDAKAEDDKSGDDSTKEGNDKDAEPAGDEDYAKAMETLAPSVRKRIEASQTQLDAIMAPLKGREAELQALGTTPQGALEWFVNVNDYAQRDPAGYLTWVVGQSTGGDQAKMEEVLKNTASKLGFKVEKAEAESTDDDDPFMTDREKALLEENRQLKASQQPQNAAPAVGPDSPQEQTRRIVMDVAGEVGADGQPARPHFEKLQPMMVEIVKQAAAAGTPMSKESLAKAYEQAELAHPETREAALERLMAAKTAAQAADNVRQQTQQKAAETAKAKSASTKIIEGPGQGATPQPAKEDADLPLEDFLRKQMAKSRG